MLDFIFYLVLCVTIALSIIHHSTKYDISFPLSYVNEVQSREVYDKDQLSLNLANISNISLTKIDDANYILSYLNKNKLHGIGLYGILFLPNKYSTKNSNGAWYNISTNTKVWGDPKLLASQSSLLGQIKQYALSFNTAILQRNQDSLDLLVKTKIMKNHDASKLHVFKANIAEIMRFLQTENTRVSTRTHSNSNFAQFHFYKTLTLGVLAGLNYTPSQNIVIANESHHDIYILPLYAKFHHYLNLFGIFDSNFNLKEIIQPHNNTKLFYPMLTNIPQNFTLLSNQKLETASSSHSCLALYRSTDYKDSTKLSFQLCETNNNTLDFGELHESEVINNIGISSIATLGRYTLLVYTDSKYSNLKLAVWNGDDFLVLDDIENNAKIISPNIMVNGSYAYITYGNQTQNKINVITLNEVYIRNLISALQENL